MKNGTFPGAWRLLVSRASRFCAGSAAPGAVALLVAVPSAPGVRAQGEPEPGELIRVYRGMMEYRDDRLRAVAARYYFPHDHDPRWLAIDFAIENRLQQVMTFERDDVRVVRPDGARLPLISQRIYRRERAGLLPLLLQIRGGAYQFPDFCTVKGHPWVQPTLSSLDFFVDSGIRRTLADVTGGRCVRGNLFFAAPAGTWASGEYELAVGGDVGVRVPFEIE